MYTICDMNVIEYLIEILLLMNSYWQSIKTGYKVACIIRVLPGEGNQKAGKSESRAVNLGFLAVVFPELALFVDHGHASWQDSWPYTSPFS